MTRSEIRRRIAVGTAAVLTLTQVACGGEETTSQGSKPGGQASADKLGLKMGDETTLKGLRGAQMKVQVLEIEDPMKVPERGRIRERPTPGRRFVGVHIRLTNVGNKPYSDAPLNGARLVTSVRKAANPTVLLTGKCRSRNFGTSLRMAPDSSRKGCLPFQVKRVAKVTAFRLRLDSGYGPETGEWAVH